MGDEFVMYNIVIIFYKKYLLFAHLHKWALDDIRLCKKLSK